MYLLSLAWVNCDAVRALIIGLVLQAVIVMVFVYTKVGIVDEIIIFKLCLEFGALVGLTDMFRGVLLTVTGLRIDENPLVWLVDLNMETSCLWVSFYVRHGCIDHIYSAVFHLYVVIFPS